MDKENALLSTEELDIGLDLDVEFDAESVLTNLDDLENQLESELAEEFKQLEFLEEERKQIGNPESLGKVVLDEVYKQFANQIGLEMTNETLIQKYNREHPESYDEVSKKVLQDSKYKETKEKLKEQKINGGVKDGYTGKTLSGNDSMNVDHTVSRKEIYENQRRKQAGLSTESLANKSENLVATNENLNKSMIDTPKKEYVEKREIREKDLKAQNERAKQKIDESNMTPAQKKAEKEKLDKALQNKLDMDDDLVLEADKNARKAINKEIRKEGTKQVAKKAGADALKAVAVTALFDFAKEVMNALVRFFKEKQKSFKLFLEEMKKALTNMFAKIKGYLQQGASMVIGTIVTEIFGPIVSAFKKLASLIKQGVSSFVESVKFLLDKKNKDIPLAEKIAHVGKIILGASVGIGAIVLGEVLEGALMGIPALAVTIPLLEMSLASLIGSFLASLISGLIGAIAMNFIDKWIANRQKSQNTLSKIEQHNKILDTQEQLIELQFNKLNATKYALVKDVIEGYTEFTTEFSDVDDIINSESSNEENEKNYDELQDLLESL